MKHLPKTLRPFFAMNWMTVVSFGLSIFFGTGVLAFGADRFHKCSCNWFKDKKMTDWEDWIYYTVVSVVALIVSLVVLAFCIWLRTRRYPGTFLYCFQRKMVEPSAHAQSPVVGYFYLDCYKSGQVQAKGASYDWDGTHAPPASEVRWKSQFVAVDLGIETARGDSESKCYILYDVEPEDAGKRNYHRGLLSFEHQPKQSGIVKQGDTYAGRMQDVDSKTDWEPIYSERIASGRLDKTAILGFIKMNAPRLLARLHNEQHSADGNPR
jgi:hypothetical protein